MSKSNSDNSLFIVNAKSNIGKPDNIPKKTPFVFEDTELSWETKTQSDKLQSVDEQTTSPYLRIKNEISDNYRQSDHTVNDLYHEIELLKKQWSKLKKNNENLNTQAQKYKLLYEDKLSELKWYYRKYGRISQTDQNASIQTSKWLIDADQFFNIDLETWSRGLHKPMLTSGSVKSTVRMSSASEINFESNRSSKREHIISTYSKCMKKTSK